MTFAIVIHSVGEDGIVWITKNHRIFEAEDFVIGIVITLIAKEGIVFAHHPTFGGVVGNISVSVEAQSIGNQSHFLILQANFFASYHRLSSFTRILKSIAPHKEGVSLIYFDVLKGNDSVFFSEVPSRIAIHNGTFVFKLNFAE